MQFFLSLCIATLSVFPLLECVSEGRSNPLPFLIIVYGHQGSGKAAIAARLRVDFNLPAISPTTYLLSNVLEETPLGNKAREYIVNGGPMPPGLLPAFLCNRLLESDCCQGALIEDAAMSLDGMKATKDCLSLLFQILAINIETSECWIVQKAENRRVCPSCGRVYDLQPASWRINCDVCSFRLEKRQADSLEDIRLKFAKYQSSVAPLLDWYKEENILVQVTGERKFEEIYDEVSSIIETKTGLHRTQQHFSQMSFTVPGDGNEIIYRKEPHILEFGQIAAELTTP
jgi:adenylate kinase